MKHTILGAGGAIGIPLAKNLKEIHGRQVRIVGRKPQPVNADDELIRADLRNADETHRAVAGSAVAYLCVGLPYDGRTWKRDWPVLMQNVIAACKAHKTTLVFVDNVYMYTPGELGHMTERSAVGPVSRKGRIRQGVVQLLLDAMDRGEIRGLIARSADFYGPGIKNSILLELVYNNLKKGKTALWQCRADKVHSFTYTPDAARAIALLGNEPAATGRVWHLPTSAEKITGNGWVRIFAEQMNVQQKLFVVRGWMLRLAGLFLPLMREIEEMSYQYKTAYFFDSSDIEDAFGLKATSARQAVREIVEAVA